MNNRYGSKGALQTLEDNLCVNHGQFMWQQGQFMCQSTFMLIEHDTIL